MSAFRLRKYFGNVELPLEAANGVDPNDFVANAVDHPMRLVDDLPIPAAPKLRHHVARVWEHLQAFDCRKQTIQPTVCSLRLVQGDK